MGGQVAERGSQCLMEQAKTMLGGCTPSCWHGCTVMIVGRQAIWHHISNTVAL